MQYTDTFDDVMPLMTAVNPVQITEAKKSQIPLFKGILYEETTDGYGNPVLRKVNENTVVIGGAITALEHITGITTCWKPATLNEIYNLNVSKSATASDLSSRICLFGAGAGGAKLDFGNVIEPDAKQRNIPDPVPFRYNSVLTGTDANKYYFKIPEADGVNYRWMLKEMEGTPTIRTLWKDSIEEGVDGTEVTDEIYNSTRTEGLVSFAEYSIKLSADDIHEYYKSIGELDMARYNTFGLYTGEKVRLEDGTTDYVNVRLFSYVTFNNKDISSKTISIYRYRIFSMV